MSISEILGYGVLGILGLYLGARLITAAFYQSKQHYERTKHGTQNNTPR